jgi:NADH:ubiquinone oxidoreductase subunit K
MPSLEQFLVVSAAFFCIGLYGVLSRRNVVAVLMSLELMFNGVNLAAVAFSRFILPGPLSVEGVAAAALTGQVFALFIVAVAAAEVALGLALVLALYRQRGTIDVTEVNLMQR